MEGTFVDSGRGTYLVPFGAWEEGCSSSLVHLIPTLKLIYRSVAENDRIVAELMRQNAASLPVSYRPVLMSSGLYPPEEIDEIVESARDEVENVRFKQYVRVRSARSTAIAEINSFQSGTAFGQFTSKVGYDV